MSLWALTSLVGSHKVLAGLGRYQQVKAGLNGYWKVSAGLDSSEHNLVGLIRCGKFRGYLVVLG